MRTYQRGHFSGNQTGVCPTCGAAFGRCPHTREEHEIIQSMVIKPHEMKAPQFFTQSEMNRLRDMKMAGKTNAQMARNLGRSVSSIDSKLQSMGLRNN